LANKKPFDWEILDKVLQFKPSLSDTSEIMKCSEDLVQMRIKEKSGLTFSAYRDKKMANVRLTLVQKAINMAKGGNKTMLIFCLKNYAGWADKVENDVSMKGEIKISSEDKEL